jgi:hypothetical protein
MNNTVYDPNDHYRKLISRKLESIPFTKQSRRWQLPSQHLQHNLPKHQMFKGHFQRSSLLLHFLIFECGSVTLFILAVIMFGYIAYSMVFHSSFLFMQK